MYKWVRSKARMLLLVAVLVTLLVILAQMVIHSGFTEDKRKAHLEVSSFTSDDSPTSSQYFAITEVTPEGTKIEWKEIKVVVKEPCTEVHLDRSKDPPVYNCPKYEKVEEGIDYEILDKDGNKRVSDGDIVHFHLKASASWDKNMAFKWKVNGQILYQDRLVGP